MKARPRALARVWWSLAAGAAIAGCGGGKSDAELPRREALAQVRAVDAADGFGARLLRAIVAAPPPGNVVISPLSIRTALRMARDGAAGTTRSAINAVLAEHDAAGGANQRQSGLLGPVVDDGVALLVANAMWSDDALAVDPAFARRIATTYGADIATVDLQGPDAVDRINAWVSSATRGKIAGVVSEPLPESTTLLLANAVYFKGRWAEAFDAAATSPASFHLITGGTAAVPMMRREGDFGYAAVDGFRIARLPYRGDRYAMYVILPDSLGGATVARDLDPAVLGDAISAMTARPLQLALPRFRAEQSIDLQPSLTALGAGIAFDRGRADFSAIYSPLILVGRHVWIDRAVHKVFVSVNEEGTEAAAATGFGVAADSSSGPMPFVVNRPFYFAVRDDHTGALVLLGLIVDPR